MISILTNKPLISIIVRTKNEERWIESCIQNIKNQNYKKVEIIIVDNNSTDKTLDKIKKYKLKTVKINNFLPGKAINYGIKKSKGTIIVCLSAHCIPTNKSWLENLVKDLNDKKIAGVYGRQEPLSYSNDLDKRDLITVFGLDKKIQKKDPFFHNANSAFLRNTWKKFPFDEKVTNIEDRVWGHQVIKNNLQIIYEPSASVYHFHGIHHNLNEERARNVVRIIEKYQKEYQNGFSKLKKNKLKIAAIIPSKENLKLYKNKKLIDYTLNSALKSKFIKDIYVAAQNNNVKKYIKSKKNIKLIPRPIGYSEDHIGVIDVLKFSIDYLEKQNKFYDIVIHLQENYPNRSKGLIDKMINVFLKKDVETLIAGKTEKRTIWLKKNKKLEMLFNGFLPSELKETSIVMSLFGLCAISYTRNIRDKDIFNEKMAIYEIKDLDQSLELKKDFK